MKNALEIRGLTRKYEGFALDSVNLTLPRGCFSAQYDSFGTDHQ